VNWSAASGQIADGVAVVVHGVAADLPADGAAEEASDPNTSLERSRSLDAPVTASYMEVVGPLAVLLYCHTSGEVCRTVKDLAASYY
jgi:hypothetical protein